MSDLLSQRLDLLAQPAQSALLLHCLHGIERECLRVDTHNQLAMTPHPEALGSALTHPSITTDYSEALLEFITGTAHDPAETLAELERIHRFTCSQLDQEYLWGASMPCPLPEEALIPIAEYGSSNIGQLKHIYRRGLALRYGKRMQCIAGIHYNFSLPESVWPLLQPDISDPKARQSAGYLALIRNFRRYSWLLMYLFGASPALDSGFLAGQTHHQLEPLNADTLYLPYATSLRMSDLGYQNNAQADLTPCYDTLEAYTESLSQAVSTPYPPYEALGTRQGDQWLQLNTNVLQIENEYYSTIRPKHVTRSGERPIHALQERGVQYVEVRCLDTNPFLPLGIDLTQACFLDTFLLYCALQESPLFQPLECQASHDNFLKTVMDGRRPGLQLTHQGHGISLQDWAHGLLGAMAPVANLLDQAHGNTRYGDALSQQLKKAADPELTPSAQVLQGLRSQEMSFTEFTRSQSQTHTRWLQTPLAATVQQSFMAQAARSRQAQQQLEQSDNLSFCDFVAAYQNSL